VVRTGGRALAAGALGSIALAAVAAGGILLTT
jgi:hypothetical protein